MLSRIAFAAVFVAVHLIDSAQTRDFRDVLIQRACRNRPELEFCNGADTPTVETTSAPILVVPPEDMHMGRPEGANSKAPMNTTGEISGDGEAKKETLGSLVRLAKPIFEAAPGDAVPKNRTSVKLTDDDGENNNSTIADVKVEDERGVLVFVSEYCVIERERFVKNCNGQIDSKEVAFCKTYPSACTSTAGVLPIISYCQRYYKDYPKLCTKQLVAAEALQFCFAFEHFCLPELHPAVPANPKPSLRRCEDVLPEARKACNPFPNPRDTFNVLRCTQFFTNCKKFIDWV